MEKETFAEFAVKSTIETTLQEALDIIDADDGKSWEEKRAALIQHLQSHKEPVLVDALADLAVADKIGQQNRDKFWSYGEFICPDSNLLLRDVVEADRESYMAMQKEYSIMKSMLNEEAYCTMVWNEHLDPKALMLTIEKAGTYVGYCGIKRTVEKPWEIAIELLPQWSNHGIGSVAIPAMMTAIRDRLGESEFRVRIDPGNLASQKLFDKLGAVPNGISEFLIHDQDALEQCEAEHLDQIDDHLIAISNKFNVEPRKLLSHVLEYKLVCR